MDLETYKRKPGGKFSLWLCSDRGKVELVCYIRGALIGLCFYFLKLAFGTLDLSALSERQKIGALMFSLMALAAGWVQIERFGAKAKERIEIGAERTEQVVFEAFQAQGLLAPGAALLDAATRPRGRPKGAGGFAESDAPLVEKMREMINVNPALTVFGAAAMFADQAAGSASFERKQRRLADRYKELFDN